MRDSRWQVAAAIVRGAGASVPNIIDALHDAAISADTAGRREDAVEIMCMANAIDVETTMRHWKSALRLVE